MTPLIDHLKQIRAGLKASASLDPLTVLVVEDNEFDRQHLEDRLRGVGCSVVAAKNGFEAMRALDERGNQFRMFLVDLGLPDISGHELIQLLRDRYPQTPVVVVTGFDDEATRNRVFDLGAVMLFPKPWTFTDCRQLLALFNLTNALTTHPPVVYGSER